MKRIIKRTLSMALACVLLISLISTGAFALTTQDQLKLDNVSVTVDGTADKTVKVPFKSVSYAGEMYTLQVTYEAESRESGLVKLSNLGCDAPGVVLSGTNYASMENRRIIWLDATFDNPSILAVGTEITWSEYTIDKNTPSGDYTVVMELDTFMDEAGDYLQHKSYSATITVTNTNCTHANAAKTDAVAATCTAAGTEAYWTCADCGKLFSDEACTAAIAAPVTVAKLGHNIVDGSCTRCDYEVPALGLYIDVEPEDTTGDGYGNVVPGEAFTAYLKVKSAEAFTLSGIDAIVTYDTTNLTLNGTDTNIYVYDGLHFSDPTLNVAVAADTEVILATMHFTTSSTAGNGTQMPIAVNATNEISKGADIVVYNGSTVDSDLGVEITSVSLTFLKEDGTELQVITQPVGTAVTAPEAPEKAGYDFAGWDANDDGNADTVPTTMPEEAATYKPIYEAQDHKITLDPDNGEDPIVIPGKTGEDVPAIDNPEKTGYDFEGWDTDDDGEPDTLPATIPADDLTGKAVWSKHNYTITYVADGATITPAATKDYTIEDKLTLATAEKAGSTFTGWKVTTAAGNWTADSVYQVGQEIAAGMYGDVTLTAQWNITATFTFEDYAYAKESQVLLVVDAAKLDSGCYLFDGQPLYRTESTDYGANGAYITLVEYEDYEDLTAVELGNLLTIGDAETVTVAYDGDVNGDGKVTVTDASIVYQMMTKNGDAVPALDILGRLEADMSTPKANATYRGSIADVNAIMAIVRG